MTASRLLLALAVSFVAAATPWPDAHAAPTDLERRTAHMIEHLGLEESPQPVREREGWTRPKRVLVVSAPPEQVENLRAAAPGVELVFVQGSAEAARVAPTVDAVLGTCAPAVVNAATRARWIQVYNAGVESCVAQPALRERKILLTNMQRIAAPVMADHVMAMLLTFSRGLTQYHDAKREGRWAPARDTSNTFRLDGRSMFIAGLGGTGLEVAKRAHAFGMRVTGTRATSREGPSYVSEVGLPEDLPRLIAGADVVVNTLPLTPETRGLFDARVFGLMKRGALFFNVGRGGTVVTNDLVAALQNGTLSGAGLDVVDPEPLPAGHPLWKLPNVVITPHVAADEDDREARWLLVRENLRRYVAGERMFSVVDTERGY